MSDAPVLIWKDARWQKVRERLSHADSLREAGDTAIAAAIASIDPTQRDRLIREAQEHLRLSLDELDVAIVLLGNSDAQC